MKRPALLLEVLIAISLFALCTVYFVGTPSRLHKKTLQQLERVEADRIASWTFTEIREMFAKGSIRWDDLPPLKQKTNSFSLPDATFQLPSLKTKALKRSYALKTLQQKENSNGKIYRLIAVWITVNGREFTYRFTAEKGLPK